MAYQLITVYSITTYRSVVNSFGDFILWRRMTPSSPGPCSGIWSAGGIRWSVRSSLTTCWQSAQPYLHLVYLPPLFQRLPLVPGEPKGVQSPHPVSHLCLLPCQIQRQHAGDGHTKEPKNVGSSSRKGNNKNTDEVTFHWESANHSNKLSLPKI